MSAPLWFAAEPLSFVFERSILVLIRFANSKLPTNLSDQSVADLAMPRNRGSSAIRRIPPPRVFRTFAKQLTTIALQVSNQIAAFHAGAPTSIWTSS